MFRWWPVETEEPDGGDAVERSLHPEDVTPASRINIRDCASAKGANSIILLSSSKNFLTDAIFLDSGEQKSGREEIRAQG